MVKGDKKHPGSGQTSIMRGVDLAIEKDPSFVEP